MEIGGVVSLNLSRGDVSLLQGVVAGELEGCACALGPAGGRCERCEALAAIRADLDRLLAARRRSRVKGPTAASAAHLAATSAERTGFEETWTAIPHLAC